MHVKERVPEHPHTRTPVHATTLVRCVWPGTDPHLIPYHDEEWGVPKLDDRAQFEHLILEVFQAGLSWLTILKRREGFRAAFANFDAAAVARFDASDRERLLADPAIIRNRAKIDAAMHDAKLFMHLVLEFGSFFQFVSQFAPIDTHHFTDTKQLPALTPEAEAMSKELKRRGFKFLGPTICYAHMQSVGVVNDHLITCFRYNEIEEQRNQVALKRSIIIKP